MCPNDPPRFPELRVATRSSNPLALVSATRNALRRAGVDHGEIARFSTEAIEAPGGPDEVLGVCSRWVRVDRASL